MSTLKDVKPGDRFLYDGKWYKRPAGADHPSICWFAIREHDGDACAFWSTDNPVTIERIKMEVKFIDKPKAMFTTGDVRPGERFKFCRSWHLRPLRVAGPPCPNGDFWAIDEDSKVLTHYGPAGQNVEIEGRSPPEPELVPLSSLSPGDAFEWNGTLYQYAGYEFASKNHHTFTLDEKRRYGFFPTDRKVLPLKSTLTVER